jgi:hypothetical protein
MSGLIWIYVIVGLFALLGVWTFVRGVASGAKRVMSVANDLTQTLKDATEIAGAYREDLSILRQIAQSGPPQTQQEPESIIHPPEQYGSRMPEPYWGRFATKPVEPEAPLEFTGQVDMTATDEEFVEQEKNTAALDFEAQERQKAATRSADQERLKALTNLSGEPEQK